MRLVCLQLSIIKIKKMIRARGMLARLLPLVNLLLLLVCSCDEERNENAGLQIAILSDIHFHDVFGEFGDVAYRGVKNPKDSSYVLIRSMEAQLHSTRMFNENYFVFLAALDDIVQRNIKYVVIPGDFSDDGQEVHLRALKGILERYSRLHDISFFLTIGNHDVVQPFGRETGKEDFLGHGGKRQPIMSIPEIYKANPESDLPVIVTRDIKNLGYSAVMEFVRGFGFWPRRDYIYWETPFSDYDYDHYNFQEAKGSATLANRSYALPVNGVPIPDVSYLVEPVSGLWLLALDGNTYLKEEAAGNTKFVNSAGYNAITVHRKYLVDWVNKVSKEAGKRGKILIAFSHYPMVDFNDGATQLINKLIKGGQRAPNDEVARIFADAGITVHFGGHMHINDTGIKRTEKGNTLVNIQVPSLAAYLPAYKILTIGENNIVNVGTVVMDSVPGFDLFFGLYGEEYNYLDSIGNETIWDRKILDSENYREFINWHLRELVRLRLLPNEWPVGFKEFMLSLSGDELLALSLTEPDLPLTELLTAIREDTEKSSSYWKNAIGAAKEKKLLFEEFENWTGFDLIFDLYRVRGADELAFADIGKDRLEAYKLIIDSFLDNPPQLAIDDMRKDMIVLVSIFQKFLTGEPSDYFELDMGSGEIFIIENDERHKYVN